MITKERLEELIKQGAKIYGIGKSNNIFCVGLKLRDKPQYLLNQNTYEKSDWYKQKLETYSKFFETKEDAEFTLLYQNITRTETLSLLNYKDFIGLDEIITNWRTSFFTPEGMVVYLYITDDKKQIIVWRVEEDNEPIFEIGNTKDNYLKACEVCRKLFLGEKVEEV